MRIRMLELPLRQHQVGIGTTNAIPTWCFGAINSTVDIKINGVGVAGIANDAVAMAIALG